MKKIHVGKSDTAASVISKVIKSSEEVITVYVPRGTKFAKTRNNFLLLKREARASEKSVIIESVDDNVLEMAEMSGMKSINPFFGNNKRAVSDIVTVGSEEGAEDPEEEEEKEGRKGRRKGKAGRRKGLGRKRHVKVKDEEDVEKIKVHSGYMDGEDFGLEDSPTEEYLEPVGDETPSDEFVIETSSHRKFSRKSGHGVGGLLKFKRGKSKKEKKRKTGRSFKKYLVGVGFLFVSGVAVYVVATVLPQVTISLDFEKTSKDFVGSLEVSSTIEESRFENDSIYVRGVSLAEKNTLSKSYPASGSDYVETKAHGTITISNAYSSQEQGLVKTTRFESPEGKIFRLDESVTVPGAKIVDGNIIPSTIEVSVTADQPGEDYNIGPVEKFTIPGFAGSPKFDGFSGSSEVAMAGGFVGDSKIPTEEDIAKAREDIASVLEVAAKSQLLLNLPPDLHVFDGSYGFSIVDEDVSERADASGQFSITARGESKLVGFKEEELLGIFKDRVERDLGVDMAIREFNVDYGDPVVSEGGESVTVPLNFTSIWAMPFDAEAFKNSAIGLNETDLKTLIFSLPGVQGGEVRFWPFWVGSVPDNLERIIVDVE